jgi:predicted nucleotide-binding protein
VKGLEEDLADLGKSAPPSAPMQPRFANNDEIFIVHGRDSPAKIEVARLLQKAGLKDVILHEQPNQGRTIIEKFEAHGGAAGFAVVVATADEVGGLDPDHLQPRARQNVIGEMFWFAGRLGRDRVCVLVKGNIEMPSDFAGIGYTEMDDRGAWKAELLRELKAAGYTNLDWGSALA